MAFITLFFYNFSFKGRKWNLKDKQFRHNFKFYDKVMLEYGLIER